MIINKHVLSIPPYISTSWRDIELLLSDGHSTLNIYLKNGTLVRIAHLPKEQLDLIFAIHQEILLQKPALIPTQALDPLLFNFAGPFLEHDETLSDSSPLPEEVKERLRSLIQGLPKIEAQRLPPIHENCHCPHCQLMGLLVEPELKEEEVSDEDLRFSTWITYPVSSSEVIVEHPYDKQQCYRVFLKNPVGCSCGETGCEHLKHVLRN